jgi:hypothetical protein
MPKPLVMRDLNEIADYLLANHHKCARSLFAVIRQRIGQVEAQVGIGSKFQFLLSDVQPGCLDLDITDDVLFFQAFTLDPTNDQVIVKTNTLYTLHRVTGQLVDYTDKIMTLH